MAATFTTDPLAAPVRSWAQRLGPAVEAEFAPDAQVFQELLDPGSLLNSVHSVCAVVLVRLDDWLGEDEPRALDEFSAAVRGFAAWRRIPLVVQLCPSPSVSGDDPWAERLTAELAGLSGVHVLGVDSWDGGLPVADPHDPARLRIAHIPYTKDGYTALGACAMRSVHALHALLAKPPSRYSPSTVTTPCGTGWTTGVRSEDELAGVVEIVEPVGVVCAITPITRPTAVVVFKALTALKTCNPIIFPSTTRPWKAARKPRRSCATPRSGPAPHRTACSG
ncbi:hypothetical protein [Amycolatopsis sp. NPDC051061]|uniref:hypothetical protein n=1 Tax=Amycolatopsis sp. NPDC051061 TaxID=3155042 RepID=UPI003447B930